MAGLVVCGQLVGFHASHVRPSVAPGRATGDGALSAAKDMADGDTRSPSAERPRAAREKPLVRDALEDRGTRRQSSLNAREDMISFVEHCILVAGGSSQTSDGEAIRQALRLVAEAFCPDLLAGAITTYNMETDEINIETPGAIYYVSVRAVVR